ncbi:MAG TPA: antitoxin family protein, partial [Blastocatellia bacterium]|nr:antitoxin family protein [Blastocatellia bacterium]
QQRSQNMTSLTVTEAVYTNGVLKPIQHLELREDERVRLTVERLNRPTPAQRKAALAELRAGIERMNFRSTEPYPTRDELHERR